MCFPQSLAKRDHLGNLLLSQMVFWVVSCGCNCMPVSDGYAVCIYGNFRMNLSMPFCIPFQKKSLLIKEYLLCTAWPCKLCDPGWSKLKIWVLLRLQKICLHPVLFQIMCHLLLWIYFWLRVCVGYIAFSNFAWTTAVMYGGNSQYFIDWIFGMEFDGLVGKSVFHSHGETISHLYPILCQFWS